MAASGACSRARRGSFPSVDWFPIRCASKAAPRELFPARCLTELIERCDAQGVHCGFVVVFAAAADPVRSHREETRSPKFDKIIDISTYVDGP